MGYMVNDSFLFHGFESGLLSFIGSGCFSGWVCVYRQLQIRIVVD